MAVNIEQIHAALPAVIGDEADLDAILRRVGRVPDYDNGKLDGLRAVAFHNKLVIQAPDGQLVKGDLPTPQSFTEIENARLAGLAAEERRRRESLFPAENYVNPMRAETENFILEVVSGCIEALQEQVSDLQQKIEAMQSHEVAA